MAGEPENSATTTNSAEENAKYGFERGEMYQNKLAGTVGYYERHVFLCYKSHDSWPSRVENSESDTLPKLLVSALKARKNYIVVKTRLTICEGGDDVKLSDGDVMIFPEMIVYRGLKDSGVEGFVEDVLVNGKPWVSGLQEELTGSYVFVCAHNNRDRRCGVCGPVLIEKFKEVIESKDLKNLVFVIACSHVGCHKHAGNVIIFSADPRGTIAGNWYGYVTPNDVLELVDKQVLKGEIIDRIWRGQMGANIKGAEEVDETNVNNREKQLQVGGSEEKKDNVSSRCQGGAKGFSRCKDENLKQKPVKKGLGRLSCWIGKLEPLHLLRSVALVGAVATVAVAYGFHRRAR